MPYEYFESNLAHKNLLQFQLVQNNIYYHQNQQWLYFKNVHKYLVYSVLEFSSWRELFLESTVSWFYSESNHI